LSSGDWAVQGGGGEGVAKGLGISSNAGAFDGIYGRSGNSALPRYDLSSGDWAVQDGGSDGFAKGLEGFIKRGGV